jgi:hypothetical protein
VSVSWNDSTLSPNHPTSSPYVHQLPGYRPPFSPPYHASAPSNYAPLSASSRLPPDAYLGAPLYDAHMSRELLLEARKRHNREKSERKKEKQKAERKERKKKEKENLRKREEKIREKEEKIRKREQKIRKREKRRKERKGKGSSSVSSHASPDLESQRRSSISVCNERAVMS